ncbi:RNA polymerase sigma factor [Solibacillus sp. FSL H8-0538]|uniref:RNA polymerase sigma factor n=1 Tax=Solibacillus sp. FSL H8-0538 TaxID=2921400 RepID=UPI0030FAD6BE
MRRRTYDEHYDSVFKYILYLTGNIDLTHDLLQETFYRFFKQDFVKKERALLIKTARNLVYDHFRKKRILSFISLKEDKRVDEQPLPDEIVERGEEVAVLYRALQQIKLSYRESVVLRYIEELSVKEVAIALGCSEAQVKNNTARGLKALRQVMEGGEDDA